MVDIFWPVVSCGGWWCIYFGWEWVMVDGNGGWWWVVIVGGIVQWWHYYPTN